MPMLNVAIIGAGPYGLSLAAHLRAHEIPFRIFGRPMDSWRAHMPKGMLLKSEGCGSNLFDPSGQFTLRQFCAEKGIAYSDHATPISLETFCDYGLAFRERMVPELEERMVVSVDNAPGGYAIRLDDGEAVLARRIVIAVGITHFEHVPDALQHLAPEFVSHSSRHHDLEPFRGRSVVVLGRGASAIDLACLLHESSADVRLVSRAPKLRFNAIPSDAPRSWWQRTRWPQSGLGQGLRASFYANGPMLYRHLPERVRTEITRRALGPSGGGFMKGRTIGHVPLELGFTLQCVQVRDGMAELRLRASDGSERAIVTQHVIAATGYKVDVNRLAFLNGEIRAKLKVVNGSPVLSSHFESSVPGIYFIGLPAAITFGPVMRFAFGAGFAARRLTDAMLQAPRTKSVSAVSVRSQTES
jgi:thioredoxin reductase